MEGSQEKLQLTRGGLFMNGRAALFSAMTAVFMRPEGTIDGAKAEADPTRTVAHRLNVFTIF